MQPPESHYECFYFHLTVVCEPNGNESSAGWAECQCVCCACICIVFDSLTTSVGEAADQATPPVDTIEIPVHFGNNTFAYCLRCVARRSVRKMNGVCCFKSKNREKRPSSGKRIPHIWQPEEWNTRTQWSTMNALRKRK